jgi:adenylate cyclase
VKRNSTRLVQTGLSALFVLLIAAHVGGLIPLSPLQRAEAWLYDVWLQNTAPAAMDDRVAILDIDEASLKSLGRWPWSRDIMSKLVDQLFDHYYVGAVGFDVVFAEPDRSSGLDILEQLAQRELSGDPAFQAAFRQLAPRLDYDGRFARALADRPVSLGFYFIPAGFGTAKSGVLPPASLPSTAFEPMRPGLPPATGFGANLAIFENAAQGAGFFNMRADADGTARQMSLVAPFGKGYYPTLSASALRVAFGGDPLKAGVEQTSLLGRHYLAPWVEVGGIRVPLNTDGSVYVPYRAGAPFPYISAVQVLAGKTPLAQLENRIVLVGDAVFQRFPRGRNPCPSDRRHARRHHPQHAAVGRGRAADRRVAAGRVADGGAASVRSGHRAGDEHSLAGAFACGLCGGVVAFLGGADGGADDHGAGAVCAQHRLRVFCRDA